MFRFLFGVNRLNVQGDFAALGFDTALLHFWNARANVNLWHTVYALFGKRAVVDLCRNAYRFQALVHQFLPTDANCCKVVRAFAPGLLGVEFFA
jgi:hypothetical protein